MKRLLLPVTAALFTTMFLPTSVAGADGETASAIDKVAVQLPDNLRGKWTAALRSADGGKTYITMKPEPFSEVSADSVRVFVMNPITGPSHFVSKVEALPDPKGRDNTFMVTFKNGERWQMQRNGFNCTYIIYRTADAREMGRIVVRAQK